MRRLRRVLRAIKKGAALHKVLHQSGSACDAKSSDSLSWQFTKNVRRGENMNRLSKANEGGADREDVHLESRMSTLIMSFRWLVNPTSMLSIS